MPSRKLAEARRLADQRDFAGAERVVQEALRERPNDVPMLDLLGYLLYFLGRPAEAEDACRRALTLRPDHFYAHKGLGLCLARRGAIDEALEHLERAIELNPAYGDLYWDLCVTLVDAGRFAAVADVLRRARAEVPAREVAWARIEVHAAQASATKAASGSQAG